MAVRVLLLDRDGVINRNDPGYIRTPDQVELLPGVVEAFRDLRHQGITPLVVTNQACINKGLVTESTLTAIHQRITRKVTMGGGEIGRFYHCPHRPDEQCPCRKPAPGMLLKAQQEWGFDPRHTWMVGDAQRDIQAAQAAGCLPALVRSPEAPELPGQLPGIPMFEDLLAFVTWYLTPDPKDFPWTKP